MLPSTRNKLTIGILERLKNQGAPERRPPSDAIPPEDRDAVGLMGPHDDASSDGGDLTGRSVRSGPSIPGLQDPGRGKRKKRVPEVDEDDADSTI